MSIYTPGRFGIRMQQFDELPPKLRDLVRRKRNADPGLMLIALEDGMSEDQIVEGTLNETGWWMK